MNVIEELLADQRDVELTEAFWKKPTESLKNYTMEFLLNMARQDILRLINIIKKQPK